MLGENVLVCSSNTQALSKTVLQRFLLCIIKYVRQAATRGEPSEVKTAGDVQNSPATL